MSLIRSPMGRRQFLIALMTSAAAQAFGRVTKSFGLISARASEKEDAVLKKTLKGCVVYYSATGSTAKVAKAIHRGMKTLIACDIFPIKKADPKKMGDYDMVAIGGPIWYSREPANLKLFINMMPDMTGKLCVPFCSHGTGPNGFMYSISKNLLKKAFTIIGWNHWYGSVFHVLHQPKPYVTDGHPDKIELQEAEAFGREIVERAQKIYAGKKDLIPEIPIGDDVDTLWRSGNMRRQGSGGPGGSPGSQGGMPAGEGRSNAVPAAGIAVGGRAVAGASSGNKGGMPEGMPNNISAGARGASSGPAGQAQGGLPTEIITEFPKIDLTKCIYPRCTACADNCIMGAIDFSMISQAALLSDSTLLVKEACLHCGYPLCQRSCSYDAIIYKNRNSQHVFDMKKCTYPECTLCLDNCLMNAIYVSDGKLLLHNNCEGCDVCWCVCPKDAISIPNLVATHERLAPSGPESFFFADLNAAEKAGKFRRLVPLDQVGWDYRIYQDTNLPRIKFTDKDEWPEMKDKQGNVIKNYYD
jgi:flavodoxin/Fe-S-cluster-containing hydrogenase component 2